MPADSRTLADEGVVIEPRVLDDAAIDGAGAQMRQPEQRRADLRAQLAAGRRRRPAAGRAARPCRRPRRSGEAFEEVLDYAERRTRACLRELPDGERTARDVLEAREGDLEIVLQRDASTATA